MIIDYFNLLLYTFLISQISTMNTDCFMKTYSEAELPKEFYHLQKNVSQNFNIKLIQNRMCFDLMSKLLM